MVINLTMNFLAGVIQCGVQPSVHSARDLCAALHDHRHLVHLCGLLRGAARPHGEAPFHHCGHGQAARGQRVHQDETK